MASPGEYDGMMMMCAAAALRAVAAITAATCYYLITILRCAGLVVGLSSTQVNSIFRQTINSRKRAKISDICLTGRQG